MEENIRSFSSQIKNNLSGFEKIKLVNKNVSSILIKLYVKNQNIIRWNLRNIWRDKNLRKNMFSWNQILRNFVYSILPEIQEKRKSEREIIFECMSFMFFLRLSVVQSLNQRQIKEIFTLNTKKYLS